MEYYEYSQKIQEPEFLIAQEIARSVYKYMCREDISKKLNDTHIVGAKSHEIQDIILPECKKLGMASEKKGLFSNYATSQLRPDYYLKINETGLILEVERGKTTINNMDFLDVWKCHICNKADYLLLVVPIIRQNERGYGSKTFEPVVKRIGSFFHEKNYVNVKACFIIGY